MNRPRVRDIGIDIGIFKTGSRNAITDVGGVKVGHCTLIEGSGPLVPGVGPIRTGVTVILPHDGNIFREKAPAASFVLNGFGKSAGLHQINELGTLETPIALTNTLNVPLVADALIEWSLVQSPEIGISTGTVNPVVGDINDGFLNDIQGRHVKKEHVFAAFGAADGGPVGEGNVGGGVGCSCMGFKGGIGTSSRVLPARLGGYTVGVLAQTNFGGMLTVNGAPVGRELGVFDFGGATTPERSQTQEVSPAGVSAAPSHPDAASARDGSCMVVIATDAPLDQRLLARVTKRAGLGMARSGFYSSNGSGDFFIAFSTAYRVPHSGAPIATYPTVSNDAMSAIFAAVVEATEEAAINSLTTAETMVGRDGNTRLGIDIDDLIHILKKHDSLGWAQKLPPFGGLS